MASLGRRPGAAPLTSADIPDNSITAAKIVDATIVAADLAPDSVGTSEIADSVTLVTPNIGTPSAGVVTNLSGVLPVGVTGGTGLTPWGASGKTLRNVALVEKTSDTTIASSTSEQPLFTATYTPLFSGSLVQGHLTFSGRTAFEVSSDGRKNFRILFTGSDITDLGLNNDSGDMMFGGFDEGGSGIRVYYMFTISGPLLTTTGTGLITATVKASNSTSHATSYVMMSGWSGKYESFMTWMEYK